MAKQPDVCLFVFLPCLPGKPYYVVNSTIAAEKKEVLQLCRNTIQSNGKGTVVLSHFVSAALTTHCSVGIYCSLADKCTVTLARGAVYLDELITTTAHWCFP